MIVKGIIKSIDYKGNTCTVRIPLFESAVNENEVVVPAILSTLPGIYNGYKEEDVVFIAFENNDYDMPVVIGKLYLGVENEKNDPRGAIVCNNITAAQPISIPISSQLTLDNDPQHSTIVGVDKGIDSYKSIADLAKNLQKQDEKLGSLSVKIIDDGENWGAEIQRLTEENVLQTSRINQNAESITTEVSRASDAEGELDSRITQTAEDINAEVAKKVSITDETAEQRGLGWNLNTEKWEIYAKDTISGDVTRLPIMTVDRSGMVISGNLVLTGYPQTTEIKYTKSTDKNNPPTGEGFIWQDDTSGLYVDGYYIWKRTREVFYEYNTTTEQWELTKYGTPHYECITGATGSTGDPATAYWAKLSTTVHTGKNQSSNIEITPYARTGGFPEAVDTTAYFKYSLDNGTTWNSNDWTSVAILPNNKIVISAGSITANNILIKLAHAYTDPGDPSTTIYNEYDTETITYSPLNTPVIDLDNDTDVIKYKPDGTKITADVSSTAQVYLGGSAEAANYTWSCTEGTATFTGGNTQTITVTGISSDKAILTCTANTINFKDETGNAVQISKDFVVSKEVVVASYWLSFSPVHTGNLQQTNIEVKALAKLGNDAEAADNAAYLRYSWDNGSHWSNWEKPTNATLIITPANIQNSNLRVQATHDQSGTPYEDEAITYSPLNTPVLDLTNDSASLPYNGDVKIGTDTVESIGKLWLNGQEFSGTYTLTWTAVDSSCTISQTGNKVIVDTLAVNTATARCSVTNIAGYSGTTLTKDFIISKALRGSDGEPGQPGQPGQPGDPGYSTATVMLYKRSNTGTPTVDWGSATSTVYTFSTQTLSVVPTGWQYTIAAAGDASNGELYCIAAIAYSNTDTDTIAVTEFGSPVLYAENGEPTVKLSIDNDFDSIPCTYDGTPSYSAQEWIDQTSHIIKVFEGQSPQSFSVIAYSSSTPIPSTGYAVVYKPDSSISYIIDTSGTTGLSSFTAHINGLTTDSANVLYTLYKNGTTIEEVRFAATKLKAGTPGDPAIDYNILFSSSNIKVPTIGNKNPRVITVDFKKAIGQAEPTAFSSQYKVFIDNAASPSYAGTASSITLATYSAASGELDVSAATSNVTVELYANYPNNNADNWIKVESESIDVVTDGADGTSVAQLYLYQRNSSTPGNPSIDGTWTYNAADGSLTCSGSTNWQTSIPAGTDPCYESHAAIVINGTGTTTVTTWSTPALFVKNGETGIYVTEIKPWYILWPEDEIDPSWEPPEAPDDNTEPVEPATPTTVEEWMSTPPEAVNGYVVWTCSGSIFSDDDPSGTRHITYSEPVKDNIYAIVQGKSTTYYSETDPADDYTIRHGDCWFKSSQEYMQQTSVYSDVNGYNGHYIDAYCVEITSSNLISYVTVGQTAVYNGTVVNAQIINLGQQQRILLTGRHIPTTPADYIGKYVCLGNQLKNNSSLANGLILCNETNVEAMASLALDQYSTSATTTSEPDQTTGKVNVSTVFTYYSHDYWPLEILPNVVLKANFTVTDGTNTETFDVSKILTDTDSTDLVAVQDEDDDVYLRVKTTLRFTVIANGYSGGTWNPNNITVTCNSATSYYLWQNIPTYRLEGSALYQWDGTQWQDIGGEVVANKVTAQYINALDINAKKIEVRDVINNLLFKADGLAKDSQGNLKPVVQIADFKVEKDSLHNSNLTTPASTSTGLWLSGTGVQAAGGSTVSGSSGNESWTITSGNSFGVTNDGQLFATRGKIGPLKISNSYLEFSDRSILSLNVSDPWTIDNNTGTFCLRTRSAAIDTLSLGYEFTSHDSGAYYAWASSGRNGGLFTGFISNDSLLDPWAITSHIKPKQMAQIPVIDHTTPVWETSNPTGGSCFKIKLYVATPDGGSAYWPSSAGQWKDITPSSSMKIIGAVGSPLNYSDGSSTGTNTSINVAFYETSVKWCWMGTQPKGVSILLIYV